MAESGDAKFTLLSVLFSHLKHHSSRECLLRSSGRCYYVAHLATGHMRIVTFSPEEIKYNAGFYVYTMNHIGTVHYLYYLLSQFDIMNWRYWVARNVGKPLKLVEICKLSVPLAPGESILRRMLTPSFSFLTQLLTDQKPQTGDQYAELFKHKVLTNSFDIPAESRETIYTHQFRLNGTLSEVLDVFTLPYLLAAEAILCSHHHWEPVLWNCYYCQVEKYHMYIIRLNRTDNACLHIYLEEAMIQRMQSPALPYPVQENITSWYYDNSQEDMIAMDRGFTQFLVREFFCTVKQPLRVPSLKVLAVNQLTINLFVRRIFLYRRMCDSWDLVPSLKYKWIENTAQFKKFLEDIQNGFFKPARKGIVQKISMRKSTFRNIYYITEKQGEIIWQRAVSCPLYSMLPTVQHFQSYSQLPPSILTYLNEGVRPV